MKSPGGLSGVPVTGVPGERFTYAVGTIGVTDTRHSPTFSGAIATTPYPIPGFSQANSRQVAILQKTDAFQTILVQQFFYGQVPNTTGTYSGNSTNARGISVWPALTTSDTRIAICGETNDQKIALSQYQGGWPGWSAAVPRYSGYIAVFDGDCQLLWSHQFFGRSSSGECAITDVSIRVVGTGDQARDVITYCGISSHGIDASGPNYSLTPVNPFPTVVSADGQTDNGVGQWDGIVGRISNSHTAYTTGGVSNAVTDFHSVVGGADQDGLFGIAEMEDDRFVVVGSTGSGASGPGNVTFPFFNPPSSHGASYSFGAVMVFRAFPGLLLCESSSPIGSGDRFTCARDVAVQLDAVAADPAHGVPNRTNAIYVVGSTDDPGLFASVGAVATGQASINGNGIPGATDGFLLAARDIIGAQSVVFQKGSFHGGIGNDGLCGVAAWNEYVDHVTVSGFTSGFSAPSQGKDLEVASYFADTTVAPSGPVVVSDLLRIRRDNVDASGDQVPAAMGNDRATITAPSGYGLAFEEHGLGSPAGGGVCVEDRGRANIVGKTPNGSNYLVWGGGRTAFPGNDEAIRTVVDMVPDTPNPTQHGIGRTDGTGRPQAIAAGWNGGTTPNGPLAQFGRQVGVAAPALPRIQLDWEGGLSGSSALLIDRPPQGSTIVAGFIQYGFTTTTLPGYTSAMLPGIELWCDPTSQYTTSLSQFFAAGTDQSVRIGLNLPTGGTGPGAFAMQAVVVLANGTFAASPGLIAWL